jgi:hypothetical protein
MADYLQERMEITTSNGIVNRIFFVLLQRQELPTKYILKQGVA